MSHRVNLLEHSVMELGTEMLKLKAEVKSMAELSHRLIKALTGLKSVLDEKGVVSADDFETAVDLNEVMARLGNTQPDRVEEKVKKSVH